MSRIVKKMRRRRIDPKPDSGGVEYGWFNKDYLHPNNLAEISDERFFKQMDFFQKHFSEGIRGDLLRAIKTCARFQAVMPEWVVIELLSLNERMSDGEFSGLDEFFGGGKPFKPSEQKLRKQYAAKSKEAGRVIKALTEHVRSGGGLNADEHLRPLAEKLGISSRTIEDIWSTHKDEIKRQVDEGIEPLPVVYDYPIRAGREPLGKLDGVKIKRYMWNK